MNETEREIEQPPIKGGRVVGSVMPMQGRTRSLGILKHLKFDPIAELVSTYRKIQHELEIQEQIRDGVRVELNLSGKPKAYRAEVHHALLDKLTVIADKLLRYGYGRVPEISVVETRAPQPLVVNLTRKGEQYVVNEAQEVITNGESDEW